MSTVPVSVMVDQLQQRVPMNLSRSYCVDKLNQAFQWIEQQGAFTWDIRLTGVTVLQDQYRIDLTGNSTFGPESPATVVDLSEVDVGKPMSVFQSPLTGFRVKIPFVPVDQYGLYQIFNTTPIPGVFAVWTLKYETAISAYQILFAPSSAKVLDPAGLQFLLQFHKVGTSKLGDSASAYFPTPDQFNSLLVDLAEAEIKRNYGLMGAEVAQQKSQASIMMLADQYRSTKMFQPGLQEEGKDAQEEQLSRV
jgi:hypothetical protein